jgi:hypothetical protein
MALWMNFERIESIDDLLDALKWIRKNMDLNFEVI